MLSKLSMYFKILLFWMSSLPNIIFGQNQDSNEWRKNTGSIELPSVTMAKKFFSEARLFSPENDSIIAYTQGQEKIEYLYHLLQRGELNKSNSSLRRSDLLYKSQYDFLNGYFSSSQNKWNPKEDNGWMKAIFDIGSSIYIQSTIKN